MTPSSTWRCPKCDRHDQIRDRNPAMPPTCPCGINGRRNPTVMQKVGET